MLFSIIVPVYKVEAYLPQCIESITSQSFGDFELILVDDASPDQSGWICDRYAEQDARIQVVHQRNGGVSSARNTGLDRAQGEYVLFVDSDDYMASGFLEHIADVLLEEPGVDLITASHIEDYGNGSTNPMPVLLEAERSGVLDRKEYLAQLEQSVFPFWSPWKNVFRKEIIAGMDLRFSEGIIVAEDCEFFMHYVRQSEQFLLVDTPSVYYRTNREGSAMNNLSRAALMGMLTVFSDNYYVYAKDGDYPGMKAFFANRFANTVSEVFHLQDQEDQEQVAAFIREHHTILKATQGLKYTVAKVIWRLFDFNKGSLLLQKLNPKTRQAS